MTKLQNMRVIEIPKFRAVSSGTKTLQEIFENKDGFASWKEEHKELIRESLYEPLDFLWHEECDINKSVWIFPVKDNVSDADVWPYEIIEFPGGIFLVATADENDNADLNETVASMHQWIKNSEVFEYGPFPQSGMCNMPNPDGVADRMLNIAQQQIFLPLRVRDSRK